MNISLINSSLPPTPHTHPTPLHCMKGRAGVGCLNAAGTPNSQHQFTSALQPLLWVITPHVSETVSNILCCSTGSRSVTTQTTDYIRLYFSIITHNAYATVNQNKNHSNDLFLSRQTCLTFTCILWLPYVASTTLVVLRLLSDFKKEAGNFCVLHPFSYCRWPLCVLTIGVRAHIPYIRGC